MATYRFQVKKHVRDDMYKNETVEIELSDSEYRNIKADDSRYSKGSALLSLKLGQEVEVLGFPEKLNDKKSKSKHGDGHGKKKSSLWKPLWAMPFKFFWRLLTGF